MSGELDAIVIGAGANGLVAAAALARAGRRVLLLERCDSLAGQARTIELAPGFFAAPLVVDSGWVPPVVRRGLRLRRLEYEDAGAAATLAIERGELLRLSRDPTRAAQAIHRYSVSDAAKWPGFIAQLRTLAGFLETLYQLPAPDIDVARLRDMLSLLRLGRRFRRLDREDRVELLRVMPMPVQQIAEDWFECEPLRAAIAACGVQDIRHGPRAGGTGFVLLHHAVGASEGCLRRTGWWQAGPDAFTAAVERVARRRRVAVRTGATVARIAVADDAVTGVILDSGEEIRAPRVLSAVDPARTLLGMVDPVWLDPELLHALRNIRFRGSTAFVLFALDALPDVPGVEHANAALGGTVTLTSEVDALERAADAVKYGRLAEQPHVDITVPTLHWPDLAPAGKHVLVARAHYAPYSLRDATWDTRCTDMLADTVTTAIEEVLPCFTSRVLHRTTLSPRDIEARFGVTEGATTHGELGLDQIMFMRPAPGLARYATPIDGLFLCGAGSHPGPDVLGGPGWLAAQHALRTRRSRGSRSVRG